MILCAVVLTDHQSGSSGQAKEQAGKNRIGLVRYADGAHSQPIQIQAAYHQVVHHVKQAVDQLLHRHGQHHAQRPAAEFFVRPVGLESFGKLHLWSISIFLRQCHTAAAPPSQSP